jgi:hypothetical protein
MLDNSNARFGPSADIAPRFQNNERGRQLRWPHTRPSGPGSLDQSRPSASQTWRTERGRGYGSHRLGAVPQSVLHGGSSQSHDLLRAFRTAYRSDTHVRPATFGTSRIPSILSGLHPSNAAKPRFNRGHSRFQKGPPYWADGPFSKQGGRERGRWALIHPPNRQTPDVNCNRR